MPEFLPSVNGLGQGGCLPPPGNISSLPIAAALNDAGTVAFEENVLAIGVPLPSSVSGICYGPAGQPTTLAAAVSGNPAPPAIGGTLGNLTGQPLFLDNSGDIVFNAPITGSATTTSALLRWDVASANIGVVAYGNEAAPSLPGKSFLSFSSVSLANDGTTSFIVSLLPTGFALYQQSATGTPVLVVADGQTTTFPGGGTFSLSAAQEFTRTLANHSISFPSAVVGGSAYFAEYLGTPGNLQSLMSTADPLPSASRVHLLGLMNQAAGNFVGFTAQQAGGRLSLFVSNVSTGANTKIVTEGDPAPGTGGVIATANQSFFINANGQIAFNSSVVGSTGVISAIFLGSPTSALSKAVAAGDAVPGSAASFTGLILNSGPPSPINSAGQVAFIGTFSGGQGIYRYNSDGTVSKIVTLGDAAPSPGTFASFGGTNSSNILALNQSGQVAFGAAVVNGGLVQPVGGFFVGSGIGTPQTIAFPGDPISNAAGESFSTASFLSGFNDSGIVAFIGPTNLGYGVFKNSAPDTLGPSSVAATNDPAPGGGTLQPALISLGGGITRTVAANIALSNNENDLVFRSGITGGNADSGYFLIRGTGAQAGVPYAAVLQGESVPGGGAFNTITTPNRPGATFALGLDGQIAFANSFTNGFGSKQFGLFLVRQDGSLAKVLAGGDTVPGGGTANGIRMSQNLAAGSAGTFAFWTGISGGAATEAIYATAVPFGTGPTSINLATSGSPSVIGHPVTFTATVTSTDLAATPTGKVTFFDFGTPVGVGTLTAASGTSLPASMATLVIASLPVGFHPITAQYDGDATFAPGNSNLFTQTVIGLPATSTSIASSGASTVSGQSVTFTATVTSSASGTPTGTVTFFDGANSLGTNTLNSSGMAKLSTSSLTTGSHSITAQYGGDSNFSSSVSSPAIAQSVSKASTATGLASSANSSSVGQAVTFTASITVSAPGAGTPTGTATFFDGANSLGASTLNSSGVAVLLTSSLGAGSHSITAQYGGDSNFVSSTSNSIAQSVVVGVPAITSLSPPSTATGGPALTLIVNGQGFVPNSVVNFNGTPRTTTFVNNTQLTASIAATDIASAGWDRISITSSGGTSNAVTFTVNGGGISPVTGAALNYVPVTPCRLVDTRTSPNGSFTGPSITGGTSRNFIIPAGSCNIPLSAAAYSLNVAVIPSGALGFLTLWPTGQTQAGVATVSSIDGRVRSNAAIVPAGAGGAISVFASNTTNMVLDIDGYFTTDPTALQFYPVTPCRVVDTRNADGPLGGPIINGNTSRTFPLSSGSCNLPANAQAYSLNLAAVPQGQLGFLTAWPTGQTQPGTANLSSTTGTVTASAAIVPAGTGGSIDIFASNSTDLVIDVNGYFAPPGTGGLSLYNLQPCRALDTRQSSNGQSSPPFSADVDESLPASGCGVPNGAQAYVVNATVVPTVSLGFLTLWPQGTPQPLAATLSALDATVTSNLAIVPTTNGSISMFASNPTQLVIDIFGYFAPTNVGVIATVSQTVTASQGGTVVLPDGSNVVIPAGALTSDQTVTLSEVSTLPKQPPNTSIIGVGRALVLSLPTPNPASNLSLSQLSARPALGPPGNSASDLLFSIAQQQDSSMVGAAPISYLINSSGQDGFLGVSGSSSGNTNQSTIPASFLQGASTVAVSQANTVSTPPPVYGPRSLSGNSWGPYTGASGKVVVLVHGIGSSVERAFPTANNTAQNIQSNGNYDSVVGFNYGYRQDIDQNGLNLAIFLNSLAESGVQHIDIEAHSEGGAVAISAGAQISAFPSAEDKIGTVVLLGAPTNGTPAATTAQNVISWLMNLTGVSYLSDTLSNLANSSPALEGLTPGNSELAGDRQQFAENLSNVNVITAAGDSSFPVEGPLIFGSTPNDGVIPVPSALGEGSGLPNLTPLPVFSVSHTELESDPNVQSSVGAQLALHINPTNLVFVAVSNGKNPPAQTLMLSNSQEKIAWTAAATTSDLGAWLIVSPSSGDTLNQSAITVSIDASKLPVGTYSGSISVTATPNPSEALGLTTGPTIQVPVTLMVSQNFTGTFTGTITSDSNGPCPGSATEAGTITATLSPSGDPQATSYLLEGAWNMTQGSGICHSYGGTYDLIGVVDSGGNATFGVNIGMATIGGIGTFSKGTITGTWDLAVPFSGSSCPDDTCFDEVYEGTFTMTGQ